MREARRRLLTIALVLVAGVAAADVGELGSDDPHAVAAAVAVIERGPADADALLAAGRACEDRLHDPPRALAIYERIARELPDARAATAATRRIALLRDQIGDGHGAEAAALARLVADADRLAPDDVTQRAETLAAAPWPGAADAMLWLAEWLRRRGRFDDAQQRYGEVAARWPGSPRARIAARQAAGCAIDAHDWNRAEALALELPATLPDDLATRDELLAAAARGRDHDRGYVAAWLALVLAIAVLLGSLVEAALRGGARRPRLMPPIEVVFGAPVAAVLVAVAVTAHPAIAPAVARISIVGLGLAWLSGTTLDLLRARGRAVRLRGVLHVATCALGVVAIGYIAMTRDGLLDLLVETVRFGPGG